MRKIFKTLIICVGVFALTGCAKTDDLPDRYTESMDYQYMYNNDSFFFPQQAKGEKGYYLLEGHYIYYMDKDNQTVVPLCNKPECLHEKETDKEKYKLCNAYVENDGKVGIAYCDGYLYYICDSEPEIAMDRYALYRIKEDGSEKELLKQWKSEIIGQWCVHRNTLYYIETSYKTEENGKIEQKYQLKSLELKDSLKKKERVVYEPQEGLYNVEIAWPQAYGNYVYFQVLGNTETNDIVNDDNYADYLYMKTLGYNIKDGTLYDISVQKENEYVQGVGFWKDKLLIVPWSPEKEDGEQIGSYIAELDGSNMQPFMDNVRQGERFYSDGKYLYQSNALLVDFGVDNENVYQVYNEENILTDTINLPLAGDGVPPVGDETGMLVPVIDKDDNSIWTLKFMDKETIGAYRGESFRMQDIAQMEFSIWDINEE